MIAFVVATPDHLGLVCAYSSSGTCNNSQSLWLSFRMVIQVSKEFFPKVLLQSPVTI